MPIRFRCPNCERLLGIARRKAGLEIHCPQCGAGMIVPQEEAPADGNLRDLEELLGPPQANGTSPLPAAAAPEPLGPAVQTLPAPLPPRPVPKHRGPGDDPLFEQSDVDELLGLARRDGLLSLGDENPAKPVTGMDAMSLDEGTPPGKVMLSSQKAVILVVAAAALIIVAFIIGFMVGSKG